MNEQKKTLTAEETQAQIDLLNEIINEMTDEYSQKDKWLQCLMNKKQYKIIGDSARYYDYLYATIVKLIIKRHNLRMTRITDIDDCTKNCTNCFYRILPSAETGWNFGCQQVLIKQDTQLTCDDFARIR